MLPFENPTVLPPRPLNDNALSDSALEEFCVVLPSAKREAAFPAFAPEIVIDCAPPAAVATDSVMLLPPARTTCPEKVPEVPEVLPPDTPKDEGGADI